MGSIGESIADFVLLGGRHPNRPLRASVPLDGSRNGMTRARPEVYDSDGLATTWTVVDVTCLPPEAHMAKRILIVEDDPDVVQVLSAYLEHEGFEVQVAGDGVVGLGMALAAPPALVILDRMLPGLDGLEILARLRREHRTPVILLTARAAEADRIDGLEAGADDYVPKPFSPRELAARVRNVLRRVEAPAEERPVVVAGPVRADPNERVAEVNGARLSLTTLEFDLLYALAGAPGRVFTRPELLDRVWGPDFMGIDRVVDVHLSNLQQKLQAAGLDTPIEGIRGVGYRLVLG